ncbi:MAG: efflux RND transporter periplasmic adaptor subunit [Hyphomicrobiaceae bacterium]
MSKLHSTPVAVLTAIVLAAGVGLAVQYTTTTGKLEPVKAMTGATSEPASGGTAVVAGAPAKSGMWAASAPGRVEPKNGEVRIGAQTPGRVAEVLVQMNDKVANGDLMVRLDDDEPQAKHVAAEAEVAVRKRERDAETVGRLAQDRRNADDAVTNAERALFQSRRDLDRTIAARRVNTVTEDDLVKSRAAVVAAKDKLEQDRIALRKVQVSTGMPLPTRLESGLATARAELSLVETAIERTRVRAASDGTVLQVTPKVGEIVAPSPELALVVMGDLTGLRVRAEVEERDVSKVRVGQKAVIRTDAYPGREFKGTVVSLGQSLAPPRLASRGPRRPTDVDALEVLIDIESPASLLPGMRADVFFLPETTAQATPAVKTN